MLMTNLHEKSCKTALHSIFPLCWLKMLCLSKHRSMCWPSAMMLVHLQDEQGRKGKKKRQLKSSTAEVAMMEDVQATSDVDADRKRVLMCII